MGLSCSCHDFDKGEFEYWWDAPYQTTTQSDTTCCECNAVIPVGTPATAFDSMEAYTPDVPVPRAPWDVDAKEEMSDDDFEKLEKAWDEFCDQYGWDSDYERFERCTSTDYRCERCSDLAKALDGSKDEGGLGFCLIGPGELIDAHHDYIAMSGGRKMQWLPDVGGVLHPQRVDVT